MTNNGRLPDLSSWVALRGDRPPRALDMLFWTAILTTVLVIGAALLFGGVDEIRRAGPVMVGYVVSSLVGVALSCVLWPFLRWSPGASWSGRATSLAFLLLSLATMFISNHTTLLVVCVAAMNAVAVFGVSGLLGYTALITVFSMTAIVVPGEPLLVGVALAVGLTMLALVSGMAYMALVVSGERAERTRELLAELERTHAELRRHTERVRELTVAEERARMSREMHDSTGHYLTALTMALSNALRFRTARPEAAWEEVEQARALARDALTDARRWVRALRPLRLEGRAGTAAMRALTESFAGGGVRIDFTEVGTWRGLAEENELVCYRALQEGLTNAMRHAGADLVEVTVASAPDQVEVTVADNGSGAPEDAADAGFGLRGLRERVSAVAGSMTAGNAPGGGFRLRVAVPTAHVRNGPPATVTIGGGA
ncbi:sensor histidine kinase [Nocardiopsis sp. MG754419]|uniref:sensor histidine kinase n=1 Tax=Nocardiopsis sp. MG754419 TaxID=2259865 RepID=UPI001BAD51EA|nr:sensor histidine kinase [Nocardiopsis sp. MG754419]MBR8744186.1 sensor histidine kinase [Nocardiopsis sp. MG754419]